MDVMSKLADKAYDLAIVDPPYGIGMHRQIGKKKGERGDKWDGSKWDDETPSAQYWSELFRVSKHQIIWGGNYFPLPPSRCFVVWDKVQRIDLADCEMAWTSFDTSARIFTFARSNLQGFRNPQRFHPTEKPINLYSWLLANYAQPGWRILDTHMGSGSSVIAANERGFEILACEIDPKYFAAAVERIGRYESQGTFAMTQNNRI
jgi:site-specific DNA-methyltransferase (adenine-specific)